MLRGLSTLGREKDKQLQAPEIKPERRRGKKN